MANRCYLYASDRVPTGESRLRDGEAVSVAEWKWDVPLGFKLLLSTGTRPCGPPDVGWGDDDRAALAGEYEAGLSRLMGFLDRVRRPGIDVLREHVLSHYTSPRTRRQHFILDPDEIFMGRPGDPAEQLDSVIAQIGEVEMSADAVLAKVADLPASHLHWWGDLADALEVGYWYERPKEGGGT